ncbi:repeatdomain containing protein, partial [Pyrenophora tritici-repentis]
RLYALIFNTGIQSLQTVHSYHSSYGKIKDDTSNCRIDSVPREIRDTELTLIISYPGDGRGT